MNLQIVANWGVMYTLPLLSPCCMGDLSIGGCICVLRYSIASHGLPVPQKLSTVFHCMKYHRQNSLRICIVWDIASVAYCFIYRLTHLSDDDRHDITKSNRHYGDVRMGEIASHFTSLTIAYSTVYSDADQRKYQSFVSLAFVWGIHIQMASNAENVPIWWRHHVLWLLDVITKLLEADPYAIEMYLYEQ